MPPTLISATFWHQLRDMIGNDPKALCRLHVQCAACKQHMTVGTDDRPMHESHGIHILPCGHMVGYCCLRDHLHRGAYSCPSCQDPLVHRRCGHLCYGIPMPLHPDQFNQIPPTIAEVGGILSMECVNCAVKAFTDGLADIYNSMDVGERPLPKHQFYAFSATLSGHRYSFLPEGTAHVRSLEIPLNMREIVRTAKEQFLHEWMGVWRTWRAGELEIRFDLYENTEYDSAKSKIRRSTKKLRWMLSRWTW